MFRKRNGQSLIEAIISIGVLIVGLLGILSLYSSSLGLNKRVADGYIATYLASEGIEGVKNIIDSNIIRGVAWNSGLSNSNFELSYNPTDNSVSLLPNGNRLIRFDPATNLYSYSALGIETNFRRLITISLEGTDEVAINSVVSGSTRGGGSVSINLEDHFFNWRP